MCAFLRFGERHSMMNYMNYDFARLSEEKKHSKLEASLRSKTDGLIRDDEIDAILRCVHPSSQYKIFVYRELGEMLTGVIHSPVRRAWLLVGGHSVSRVNLNDPFLANGSDAVTVVARGTTSIQRMIFIYIPRSRTRKDNADN